MSEKPTSLVGCGVGGGTREGTLYPMLYLSLGIVSRSVPDCKCEIQSYMLKT